MHRLLKRQWKYSFGAKLEIESLDESTQKLLAFINEAYIESDNEKKLLEHMVELNSKELGEAYKTIKAHNLSLKDEVDEQTKILQQYQDAIHHAFLVSKADISGKIIYANTLFCEVSGYTFDELKGKTHRVIRHPQQDGKLFKSMWATITAKKLWRGKIQNRAKDGSSYYVDATIFPLLDASNNILEYVAIRQNITQIEESRQKLDAQLSYTKMIFDNQENIVLTAYTIKGIIDANKNFYTFTNFKSIEAFKVSHECVCELFIEKKGFLSASTKQRHWTEPILENPQAEHRALMADAQGQEHIFSVALKDVHFQGQSYFIISFSDITQLVYAQELAEESGKAKSQFMANMSHELRTPLNGINGFTKLMQSTPLTQNQQKYINFIEHSTDNLLKIINNILDFSKIEQEFLELELLPINLLAFSENALKVFLPETISKNISYLIDIDQTIPECLMIDKFRLSQVLTNLINNAIKFTPKEGTIKVSLKRTKSTKNDDTILFSVCDTGIGIEKKNQEKIFHTFEQADNSTTRMYGGTGLGLSISASLCKLMGGDLELESEVGKGSTFFFSLVLKRCIDTDQERSQTVTNESKDKVEVVDLKVLVVDDYEVNRILLEEMLVLHGVHVDFAINGAEALKKVEQKQYDIIFMDINMPVMNGVDATIEMHHLGVKTPIIACTSNAVAGDKQKYLDCGMDDYISKPIDHLEINRVLKKFNKIPSSSKETQNNLQQQERTMSDHTQEIEATIRLIEQTKTRLGFPMSTVIRLFQTFLKGSIEGVTILNTALKQGDIETIKSQAHALKGTSHTFNMLDIVEKCLALEYQENPENNEVYIEQITQYIELLDTHQESILSALQSL